MRLTDIRIHEIVEVDGLPSHARGTATFDDGHTYEFVVLFAHSYKDSRIFVYQHREAGPQHPGGCAARAIHERLGFTDIARRERDAIACFELERVAACRKLMRATES